MQYYTDPVSRHVFRTLKSVINYLETGQITKHAYIPRRSVTDMYSFDRCTDLVITFLYCFLLIKIMLLSFKTSNSQRKICITCFLMYLFLHSWACNFDKYTQFTIWSSYFSFNSRDHRSFWNEQYSALHDTENCFFEGRCWKFLSAFPKSPQ